MDLLCWFASPCPAILLVLRVPALTGVYGPFCPVLRATACEDPRHSMSALSGAHPQTGTLPMHADGPRQNALP